MTFELSEEELDKLFPAHIRVDGFGRILSLGPSLSSRLDTPAASLLVTDVFDVLRPLNPKSMQDLLSANLHVLLALKSNPLIRLQGIVLRKHDAFFFLLGHLPNINESENAPSYRFSDFAPFDGSKEMFLAAQIRKGLLNDTRELVDGLEAEKQAAERANLAKSEFLACMSHEIRTPLNGVLGLAALLEQTELDEAQNRLLNGVTRSGKTLLALLNDIIDVSRMDAAQITIEPEVFNLGELKTALSAGFTAICEEKGLEFRISLADDQADQSLIGDDIRILQILNNLVSNAIKFTESGMVAVDFLPLTQNSASASILKFVVRDTGIGISPEHCATIFQPFVQADSSIIRRFGGTGLGLTICERLTSMMDGKIAVESELDKGSTFSVQLALKPVSEPLCANG